MVKHFLLTVALVGFVTGLTAQSPLPPTPTEAAHEKQQAGQRVNANRNLLRQVTILLKKQNEFAERQRRKDREKPSSDWWIVGFTAALTSVGIIQLIAMFKQASYMRYGLAETKRAADAAKQSADAATRAADNARITQRAIVLIDSVKVTTKGEAFGLDEASVVIITLKNFGPTIANRVTFRGRFSGGVNKPIAQTPNYTIAPQGTISWVSEPIGDWLRPVDLRVGQIDCRQLEFTYELDLTYVDAFNKSHAYHCGGKYQRALKEFIVTSSVSD